tara:strand:- start:29328 stop:31232 length:1905 start_codon:yes stop_codon:yes gene_type:complete
MFNEAHIKSCVTLDFETDKIQNRPVYPPKPVGLAIRWPDGVSEYLSWGHPSGNNCTLEDVMVELKYIWESRMPVLFFNAKFDLAVAQEGLGLPILPWNRVHDAQFLSFLADPHTKNLDLKSLSDTMLDWPPEELDEVSEWIWENRRELKAKHGGSITRNKGKVVKPGVWFSHVPAEILEPYAIGDVDRTWALFDHLYPLIAEYDMCDAYDRELKILPIFMENERDGMHVDLDALTKDVPAMQESLVRADELLRDMLGVPDLNIDADEQLADALSDAGVILEEDWVLTAKSKQRSVAKDNLPFSAFQDKEIGHIFFYRNRLTTALATFLVPWLAQASQRDGIISTNWNQVRGGDGGTRTGRPSTSRPNFLNIPKEFKQEYDMPKGNKYGLSPLPYVRDYVLPDPGEVFIHRDFDGQEMRIFAHYSCGPLLDAYQADPDTDPHEMVGKETARLQEREYNRKKDRGANKILNFQALYGGGIPAAAKAIGCSTAMARQYKEFHDKALPERTWLNDDIKHVLSKGDPIRTWGGRCYYAEPRKVIGGQMRDFLYKMINYLCQGSAADVTKEAIIRWYYHPKRTARFLVTVYDEINISAKEDEAEEQMALLKEVMESIEMDLLMKSSGKIGSRWGELEECD